VIRLAQLLLLIAAGALWLASRLQWVVIESFDGLGQPKTSNVSGAVWSNALLPLAVLLLATAVAGIAVRGWLLRAVAVLIAMLTLALGYLGVSLIVTPDVGPRGAELAGISVISLVGSERHYAGAVLTLVAAVGTLGAAVLFMRAASLGGSVAKYAAPADRRAAVHSKPESADGTAQVSEREMWDALDEGRDPTERRAGGAT
jgi:uncharacterized membrane protein (TIGR02234 family)